VLDDHTHDTVHRHHQTIHERREPIYQHSETVKIQQPAPEIIERIVEKPVI
jgi:hypothetical protein